MAEYTYATKEDQISIFEDEKQFKEDSNQEKMPKAFDYYYYHKKIEHYQEGSKDNIRWKSYLLYALRVKDLYIALTKALNETIYSPVSLPRYVRNKKDLPQIEELAKKLEEQEKRLAIMLGKDASKINNACEKHSTIKELREYGAKCWLMLRNYQTDNFYHAVIDFKTRNEDKDLSVDRNIALLYMGHAKTKNFVKTKIKNYFATKGMKTPFKNDHPQTSLIYANMDSEKLFDEIINSFNGYDYKEKEEWFEENLKTVKDEKAKQVIEFYSNYPHVKNVYKQLFSVYELSKSGEANISSWFRDMLDPSIDYFVEAKKCLVRVEELLYMAEQNEEYSFLLKDCNFLKNKLTKAIDLNQNIYNQMIEQSKNNINKFKNSDIFDLLPDDVKKDF